MIQDFYIRGSIMSDFSRQPWCENRTVLAINARLGYLLTLAIGTRRSCFNVN